MREPFDILTEAYRVYTIQQGRAKPTQSVSAPQTRGRPPRR
jgi:hypothetical protein